MDYKKKNQFLSMLEVLEIEPKEAFNELYHCGLDEDIHLPDSDIENYELINTYVNRQYDEKIDVDEAINIAIKQIKECYSAIEDICHDGLCNID